MKVPFAPNASAFSTSWPDRIPPSICTSIRSPTARAIEGSMRIDDSAPSSCRPPWFDTMIASAPKSAARCASSTSRMPLRMNLPPQASRILRTLSQSSCGSNCSWVQLISELRSPTPLAWPTILPKLRRFVPSIPKPHCGLVARLSRFFTVSRGGAVRSFFRSLWRWPRICRSSVRTSAEQFAAFARAIIPATKSSSRIT